MIQASKQDRAAGTLQNLPELVAKKKNKPNEAPKCISGVPSTRGNDPPVAEKWSKDKRQKGMASLLPQEGYIRA